VMGLDERSILHECGLGQIFTQATKHTALSKTFLQWAMHEHTQATNHPHIDSYGVEVVFFGSRLCLSYTNLKL
jgi:hypothetical protein